MSGVLRPALLDMAEQGLFNPIWSDRIGDEWRRNAGRLWPIAGELLDQEWRLMEERFSNANQGDVSTLEQGLRQSDKKDWHVIAAGISSRRSNSLSETTVLTWNLKDFRRSELRRNELGLSDPDTLLARWWPDHHQLISSTIRAAIAQLVQEGRRQPDSTGNFLKRERLFRLATLYAEADIRG